MTIKPGYKMTGVRVIPKDWSYASISPLETYGWAKNYSEFGAPFVRITNLVRSSPQLKLCDLKRVQPDPEDSEGLRTSPEHSDLLISITADIGIVGVVDSTRLELPAYINQHIALVRIATGAANSKFIAYFWGDEQAQRRFRAFTDSGAKAGMSLREPLKTLFSS